MSNFSKFDSTIKFLFFKAQFEEKELFGQNEDESKIISSFKLELHMSSVAEKMNFYSRFIHYLNCRDLIAKA